MAGGHPLSKWELISLSSPAGETMSHVPLWVIDTMNQMYEKDGSVFLRAAETGKPIYVKGKTYQYAITCNGQAGQWRDYYRRKRRTKKRNRATALVVRDGKVLLVRYKGRRRYSLPGGAIEEMDSGSDAAVVRLKEKTDLEAYSVYPMFNYESRANRHRVYSIDAKGRVRIRSKDLSENIWWDGSPELPIRGSVRIILSKAKLHFD